MVTIGIPTYNRKNTLIRMADSLHESELPVTCHVRIYDDASTEYGVDFLKDLFPEAVSITRHSSNGGADANMKYMYKDFLQSKDAYFFNADSDLIFRRDWLKVLLEVVDYTDGVISAFNANTVETLDGRKQIGSFSLIQKKVLGAAGVLFTYKSVETIMRDLEDETAVTFDIKWSDNFSKKNRLWALEESVVQHIGIRGFNSDGERFVFGDGFRVDSFTNGQILNDVLLDMSEQTRSPKSRMKVSIFPFSEVAPHSNVIIYGAGLFGSQYVRQIELTKYCNIVAVADGAYQTMEGIIDPSMICRCSFDYVVIAINNPTASKEIKKWLCAQGVNEDKIIENSNARVIRMT